jgi:hypothetical protein
MPVGALAYATRYGRTDVICVVTMGPSVVGQRLKDGTATCETLSVAWHFLGFSQSLTPLNLVGGRAHGVHAGDNVGCAHRTTVFQRVHGDRRTHL